MAVSLILALAPTAAGAQDRARGPWWDRSAEAKVGYYWIKTDLPADEANDLARQINVMHAEYSKRLASLPQRVPSPLNVLIFKSRDDYLETLRTRFGVNAAGSGGMFFVNPSGSGLAFWTGALSDRWGRKGLITAGMLLQGIALAIVPLVRGFWPWAGAAALLGAGTAMVYPTLLAAIGDVAHPRWRGSAVGVYRLWRDSGFVAGALIAGVLADLLGMASAIGFVAALTFLSGLIVALRMPETLHDPRA